MKKIIKKTISFVIRNEKEDILLVKRPTNDKDLPNLWGLPAGTLKLGESWRKGIVRAGKEKLGVQLKINGFINEGKLDRKSYMLHMKLFNASIVSDNLPIVPQPISGITQYVDWKWAKPKETIKYLRHTAPKGSLCCTLYLVSQNIINKKSAEKWGAKILK